MSAKSILSRLSKLGRTKHSVRNWEQEYARGEWSLLSELDEMARYWVALGYCSRIPTPSVLDAGCGPGLMEQKLRLLPYGSYTGTDISESALGIARSQMPAKCRLICTDFTSLALNETFDIIVFMESLDLQLPVMDILTTHIQLLRPGGRIVLSIYDGASGVATQPLWKEIAERFRIEDSTRIHNLPTGKRWTVGLLAPRQ